MRFFQHMRSRLAERGRKTHFEEQVERRVKKQMALYKKENSTPDLKELRQLLDLGFWQRVNLDYSVLGAMETDEEQRKKLGVRGSRILKALQDQVALQREFPDLFCTKCNSRAVQQDLEGCPVVNPSNSLSINNKLMPSCGVPLWVRTAQQTKSAT